MADVTNTKLMDFQFYAATNLFSERKTVFEYSLLILFRCNCLTGSMVYGQEIHIRKTVKYKGFRTRAIANIKFSLELSHLQNF